MQLIQEGSAKLSSVPSGGAGGAAPAAAGAAAAGGAAAEAAPVEEEKEEPAEESDEDVMPPSSPDVLIFSDGFRIVRLNYRRLCICGRRVEESGIYLVLFTPSSHHLYISAVPPLAFAGSLIFAYTSSPVPTSASFLPNESVSLKQRSILIHRVSFGDGNLRCISVITDSRSHFAVGIQSHDL